MAKKIVLSILAVGLIGVLVAGAIIRTVDKTENVAEARGLGRGRSGSEGTEYVAGQGQGRGGNGQGGGYGRSAEGVERQYPNYETPPGDWEAHEGIVVEAPEAGGDLVVTTDGGQEIRVGTGPGYMEAQGFALEVGERVQVQGYWEDGELKAAHVTRLRDGQTITLRDQFGRPAWSGAGWRAMEQQAAVSGGGRGQGGQGQASQVGQAGVDEWLTLDGAVTSVDSYELIVQTADGQEIIVVGRPWIFAQEQGLVLGVGDPVQLIGFAIDGEFEIGQIDNLSTGDSVQIRDDSGRPLWAGRGRRGS